MFQTSMGHLATLKSVPCNISEAVTFNLAGGGRSTEHVHNSVMPYHSLILRLCKERTHISCWEQTVVLFVFSQIPFIGSLQRKNHANLL